MGDVKFPGLVLGAEFGRLFEDFLNSCVVLFIPVQFGLHHQDRDVLVKAGVVFLQGHVDSLGVTGNTRILNSFGFLTESVDVVRG